MFNDTPYANAVLGYTARRMEAMMMVYCPQCGENFPDKATMRTHLLNLPVNHQRVQSVTPDSGDGWQWSEDRGGPFGTFINIHRGPGTDNIAQMVWHNRAISDDDRKHAAQIVSDHTLAALVPELVEALRKTLTCASLNSDVQQLVQTALANAAGKEVRG